jgi:adenylyl-sulfate kinase
VTAIVAWFTGLSGAGKSTIANRVADLLRADGRRVRILDGDVVRTELHRHLGFSPADIRENNRLIAGLCQQSAAGWDVILVPVISPFRDARVAARELLGRSFVEVYVRASIPEVMRRDPKGLYRQVQEGRITGFIGLSPEVPYEPPEAPEIVLDTERADAAECARHLASWLEGRLTSPR